MIKVIDYELITTDAEFMVTQNEIIKDPRLDEQVLTCAASAGNLDLLFNGEVVATYINFEYDRIKDLEKFIIAELDASGEVSLAMEVIVPQKKTSRFALL